MWCDFVLFVILFVLHTIFSRYKMYSTWFKTKRKSGGSSKYILYASALLCRRTKLTTGSNPELTFIIFSNTDFIWKEICTECNMYFLFCFQTLEPLIIAVGVPLLKFSYQVQNANLRSTSSIFILTQTYVLH